MNQSTVYFHGALNDFLPRRMRNQRVEHTFDGQPSVKDMIESLGVPHTEIDTVLVNGSAVDYNYLVRNHDQIEAYPPRWGFATEPAIRVRPEPPQDRRFVLDAHLGRLAAYLRMLGFDTLYRNDFEDDELARISSEEDRILLSRDVGLLKRGRVRHGYFVRETNPVKQIREIVRHYALLPSIEPFRRCSKCNGLLEPVAKELIEDKLPPMTSTYFDEFRQCMACGQIYWRGSHMERLDRLIRELQEDHEQ